MRKNITYEELHKHLSYDSKTGLFTRKISCSNRVNIGDLAGTISRGYIMICVCGVFYFAHRLAWLYEKGYLPEKDIDHIDRVKHHNWISNLREASRQCNMRNTGNRKNNTSGVKGVVWNKEKNKWQAQITINKKNKNLGRYKNFHNAVCARLSGEQCLNWSGCDISSPAYKYVQKMLRRKK